MKKRPPIPPKELRALWEQVPKVNCKGLCSDCCGPIGLSSGERKLIEQRAGKPLRAEGRAMRCSMLTHNGRCSVYSIRPLVCRIWGAVEAMRCPHGCEPERWLTDAEALKLLTAAARLYGDDEGEMTEKMIDELPPEALQAFRDYVAEGEQERYDFLAGLR